MSSKILDNVLANRNRTINLKVVFVDVVSYSKRRSLTQAEVIDTFMVALNSALEEISQKFVKYAQDNDLNFQNDVICLPSGDGAAIIFPFDGLHDIHLEFSKQILKNVHDYNTQNQCDKFQKNGWCNCHSNFNLTVGISEGKGILYKDVNGNYNVAGNVINLASRVMGAADKNQIMVSQEAYHQLVDLVDDPHLDEKFTPFHDVKIKHGQKITIYQYIDPDNEFINCAPPEALEMNEKANVIMTNMQKAGFPIPDIEKFDKKRMFCALEQMGNIFGSTLMQDNEIKSINPLPIKPSDSEQS